MPFLLRSLEQKTYTATADAQFNLVSVDRWWNYCDVFVTTNAAYIGDLGGQLAQINPGDVYTIPGPVNVFDVWFKNVTGGSNTTVTIIGTPMTQKQADTAGLGVKIV